jgi:hypothetical protein
MKTAMSAPAIWLVLAALADPVAAQVDIRSRFPVGDAIEAPKPQDLKVVTRGMRPPSGDERLALAAPKAKMPTARRPEDESAPKPNDSIIDVIVAYCLALHGRMARGCGRSTSLGGEKTARYPASPVRLWNPISL